MRVRGIGETVGFSRQVCCVYVASARRLKALSRDVADLTYGQLTALLALEEARRPVLAGDLADYMMVKRESVRDILTSLEDRGLVAKAGSGVDARLLEAALTREGEALSSGARSSAVDALRALYWGDLPENDFFSLMTPTIKGSLARLRGGAVPALDGFTETDRRFSSGFLVFWERMLARWDEVCLASGPVGLSAFRVLSLLREHTSMGAKDVARMLLMSKATVSRCKGDLLGLGLAEEAADPFDARGTVLAATRAGRSLALRVEDELDSVTRTAHGELSDVGAVRANARHYFMYGRLVGR